MTNHHAEVIHRRRFPQGYFLDGNLRGYLAVPFVDSTTSHSGCGTILLFGELYRWIHPLRNSHLKTAVSGVELFWYPNTRLSIGWNEILRLKCERILGLFPSDVLVVDRPMYPEEFKTRAVFLTPGIRRTLESKKMEIHLQAYEGWPEGKLRDEMEKYIPDIIRRTAQ
jgi:hypothetical protein